MPEVCMCVGVPVKHAGAWLLIETGLQGWQRRRHAQTQRQTCCLLLQSPTYLQPIAMPSNALEMNTAVRLFAAAPTAAPAASNTAIAHMVGFLPNLYVMRAAAASAGRAVRYMTLPVKDISCSLNIQYVPVWCDVGVGLWLGKATAKKEGMDVMPPHIPAQ